MDGDSEKSVYDRVYSAMNKENGKFLLLRHYNTFAFTEDGKRRTQQEYPDAVVCLYDFKLSDMVSVFAPFLDFAREIFGQLSEDAIDRLLDECDIYSLHRSVFKSFFQGGLCVREENLLIDEVAFEQDRIASAVVEIVSHLAGDRQVIFLLNDMQYANGSSMHFIHNLIEDGACRNIAVVATYNEAKVPLSHMEPIWDRFYRYICDQKLVTETSLGMLVSVYTQNFSQALLLCGELKALRRRTDDPELDYTYYYLMCMAHMYSGKLDEAAGMPGSAWRSRCGSSPIMIFSSRSFWG